MDDALLMSRSQTEESQAARMIYSTTGLFKQFIKYETFTFTFHRLLIPEIKKGNKNPFF